MTMQDTMKHGGPMESHIKARQKYWFTSDNHFFHKNVLKFCEVTRQGTDVNDMNELMIAKWNSQVGIKDVVYLNGDFSFASWAKTLPILERLNGILHLVRGNHDGWIKPETEIFFESIQDYKEISIEGIKVIMFHYPIEEWNHMHRGAFHLFGHVHGGHGEKPGRSMDIGIDARPQCDMGLWEWEEIKEKLLAKPILEHHGKMEE